MNKNSKSTGKTLNRRQFINTSLATIAGITIVPSHVLAGLGHIAPSDKLNVAGIGVNGRGRDNLREVGKTENIVALCDVDWSEEFSNQCKLYPKAKRYKDYREMLDTQKDIDAVIISTPDHTHAMITLDAMKRGKHVYTEKPLTKTVYEARMLTEAAQKYNVATQMGNGGQAGDGPRRLREMIKDGAIGDIYEVHHWTDRPNRGLSATYWPQGVSRPTEELALPSHLDWDLWIGPAPFRPYHSDYHPFNWRGWLDFGSGALGDIGCHALDSTFRALELKYPTNIQAVSTLVNQETFPLGSMVTFDFEKRKEMPAVRLTWYDGGLRPPRFPELDEGVELAPNGVLYVGTKGKILGNTIFPKSLRDAYEAPEPYIPSSPGQYKEWIDACKGGAKAGSNFEWAGPLTESVLLGNIALRPELREKLSYESLKYDAESMSFPNLPEADKFLHYEYREGWKL